MTPQEARLRPLRRADVLHSWSWREDIVAQIVNPDIDGLLTAALLYEKRGWPIVGLYDTEHLWLAPEWRRQLRRDFARVLWVDLDMCWPGARSLGQHVVLVDASDLAAVSAYQTAVNPSLLAGHAARPPSLYPEKYPFGTFQWTWWLVGLPQPPVGERLATGLVWMPDGGFRSIQDPRWRANCIRWATVRLPGSPLAPLVEAGLQDRAGDFVREAAAELKARSGVGDHWQNYQYKPTQARRTGVVVLNDPGSTMGRQRFDYLLAGIAGVFGWAEASLPAHLECFEGTWLMDSIPPAGWPAATTRHEVVSLAVTGQRQYCYTLPDSRRGRPSLREVLP